MDLTTRNRDFASRVSDIMSRNTKMLTDTSYATREAAVHAASDELEAAAAQQVQALQAMIAHVQAASTDALEAVRAEAEAKRKTLSAQLAAEIWRDGSDELTSLVRRFREQPTRALATAIREKFDTFSARAQHELGDVATDKILGAIFAAGVFAEAGMSAAVNGLSRFSGDALLSPLYLFCEKARTPAELETALLAVEAAVCEAARVATLPGSAPADAVHRAVFDQHRRYVTRRDLSDAQRAIEQ